MMPRDAKKAAARTAVANAVAAGVLVRPAHCTACGAVDARMRDGRTSIQGHHYLGYDRPLEVKWLCHRCHYKDDGRARLTAEQVVEIRNRYARGANKFSPDSAGKLAREFGVTLRTVKQIVHGEVWRDAPGPIAPLPASRVAASERTHCPRGHAYDEANTYLCARGHRYCRACQNEASRRKYAKRIERQNHILGERS